MPRSVIEEYKRIEVNAFNSGLDILSRQENFGAARTPSLEVRVWPSTELALLSLTGEIIGGVNPRHAVISDVSGTIRFGPFIRPTRKIVSLIDGLSPRAILATNESFTPGMGAVCNAPIYRGLHKQIPPEQFPEVRPSEQIENPTELESLVERLNWLNRIDAFEPFTLHYLVGIFQGDNFPQCIARLSKINIFGHESNFLLRLLHEITGEGRFGLLARIKSMHLHLICPPFIGALEV